MSCIKENFDSSRGIAKYLRALRRLCAGLKIPTVKSSESEGEGDNDKDKRQKKLNSKGELVRVHKEMHQIF